MSSANSALGQSDDDIHIGLSDSKEILRRLKDYELLRQVDIEKDNRIANLEAQVNLLSKTAELDKREIEIQQKIIAVKDMEIAALKSNFDQMKDVADRAIKLAETSKPSSNWKLWGLLGVAAFALGLAI